MTHCHDCGERIPFREYTLLDGFCIQCFRSRCYDEVFEELQKGDCCPRCKTKFKELKEMFG